MANNINPRKQWIEHMKKFMKETPQDFEFIGKNVDAVIKEIRTKITEETLMKEFYTMKSNEARMEYLLKQDSVKEAFKVERNLVGKSAIKAKSLREEGNVFFKKQRYRESIERYSKAIMHAPMKIKPEAFAGCVVTNGNQNEDTEVEGGEDQLALSFANRSAALLHLKEYDHCLKDIDGAIEQEYPGDLQYKLFDRKGKCYYAKKDREEALNNFSKAKELLNSAKLDEKGMKLWKNTLEKQMKLCNQLPETPIRFEKEEEGLPKVTGDIHAVYNNASKSVRLEHKKEKGRLFVADQPIHVGDVITSEKPYAFVVNPDFFSSHCYNCCHRLVAPLPCCETSKVVFCSPECRQQAWEKFHQVEFQYLGMLDQSWCGTTIVGHLIVRTALLTGFTELVNELNKAKAENDADILKKGHSDDGRYVVDKFSTIYHMEANLKERMPDGLFDFAVYAYYLMKLLEDMGFFGKHDYDKVVIGGCLLHLLQVIQCNAIDIYEVYNTMDFENLNTSKIGIGIYPTTALVNHSCDPNCDVNFYDNGIILRANRNIYKGEEITFAYADQVFYNVAKHSRQAMLEFRYSFYCKCQACQKDWPKWQDLPVDSPSFRCTDCRKELVITNMKEKNHVRCENRKCNSLQNLEEGWERLKVMHDVFSTSMEDASAGRIKKALDGFQDYLILMQKYICPPWRYMTSCQAAVRHCYRILANRKV